ncbi:ead/Ea22-like family protein [Enterobacter intestinihominis]|uniref:ead/Ea22-like family protein n=1 Tax=Enterobacter intestinihominis TaxID=3133180 RepID=UPI003B2606F1
MSNIDKRALREAAERAESDSWGYDRDEFNEALTPSTVLALLDELEAKDSMIAAQQHEIRTLLNALEGRPCPKCNDTGMADSGGTQPWGEPISVPCDCAAPPSPVVVPEGYRLQPISEYDAMCAAMLQGAENAESRCTIKTAPALDSLTKNAESRCGNSPVIQDGWVLVPEEPTHEMLEAGDEQFGTYDVYRRMIAASPQQK